MVDSKLRFRGLKTDTWTVTPRTQIGPDVDRDAGAEILRTMEAVTFENLVPDAGGSTFGEVGSNLLVAINVQPVSVLQNQLIGAKIYGICEDGTTPFLYYIESNTASSDGYVNATISETVTNRIADSGSAIDIPQHICVKKTGSDSAAGDYGHPLLTVQAAIDKAVTKSWPSVLILDDGVYTERLDLKGVNLYAASGKSPTIKFPVTPFSEAATGISVAVAHIEEFTYNGAPCLYAAAADGLYRSMDGKAWSKVLLSGHDVGGCCVRGGKLYAISRTDGQVYKIVDAGTSSVFATTSASGIGSSTVHGGIWALGQNLYIAVGDDPIFAVWYNGTWHTISDDAPSYPVQIVYDASISTRYAFARFSSLGGGFETIDLTNNMSRTHYPELQVPLWLAAHSGRLYAMTATGIMSMVSGAYPDIWTTAVENGPWWNRTPLAIYWDDFGYIVQIDDDYIRVSRDGMSSFHEVGDSLFDSSITSLASFLGIEVTSYATGIRVWDRRSIVSTTAAKVSGIIHDGSDHSVHTYAGPVSLEWFRATGYFKPCAIIGHTATHKYGRFASIVDSSFCGTGASELVLDHVEIATVGAGGLRVSGPNVRVKDCTVAASSRGLILDAVPLEVTRSIFAGNVIDVEANVAGASLASCCYETASGYALTNTVALFEYFVSSILPSRYFGNPLFVDDSGADLRLKSIALGYPADSGLLINTASGSMNLFDMREAIGARKYSRLMDIDDTVFGVDYMIKINPSSITPAWQPAGYQKSISATGSIYGSETNAGAYKVARKLTWNQAATTVEGAQLQAAWLRYLYSLDTVFDVGDTLTGTDWVPRFVATKTAGSSFGTLAVGGTSGNPPDIAPNQYAGAWCEDEAGNVIGRIASHGAPVWDGVAYNQYVVSVTWAAGALLQHDATVCNIDVFRRYRIDKSQPFTPSCQVTYNPGKIPEIPSAYDLTIAEVDE